MSSQIQVIDSYQMPAYDAVIISLYQGIGLQAGSNIAQRVTFFSEQLLNKSYSLGALGEGIAGCFDQNPLYRTDTFDCVTFINTVLALAFSHNLREFQKNILQINYYEADPKYQKRFHFISVDWNPKNAQNGFVKDITTEIYDENDKPIYEIAHAIIDRPGWIKHRTMSDIKLLEGISPKKALTLLNKLHKFSSSMQSEANELPYLPFTKLFNGQEPNQKIFQQFPDCSVIEIVRPNWDLRKKIGTNLNVSHVGFALRLNNELIFRQASLQEKSITDMPLIDYLRDVCFPVSAIKGINIQKVPAG